MQTQIFHSHLHWGSTIGDSFFSEQPHGCSDSNGLAPGAPSPIHHGHAPVIERRHPSEYSDIFQRVLVQPDSSQDKQSS